MVLCKCVKCVKCPWKNNRVGVSVVTEKIMSGNVSFCIITLYSLFILYWFCLHFDLTDIPLNIRTNKLRIKWEAA